MPTATRKLSRTFQVTRFLGRLPASCWDGRPVKSGLAGAFAWGIRDPFGMKCTGSDHDRSYAVTI